MCAAIRLSCIFFKAKIKTKDMSKRRFKVMMAQSPVDAREFVRKVTRDNDAPKNTKYYLQAESYFGRCPQVNVGRYVCDTYFAVCYGKVVRAFCRTRINGCLDVEFGTIRVDSNKELEGLINGSYEITREEFLNRMDENNE